MSEEIDFSIENFFNENKILPIKVTVANTLPVSIKTENTDMQADIEQVVARIEKNQIDITADYNNWIQIGFALASELAETGRIYFHRLSRIYYKYSAIETDKQYDSCLKNRHAGVTIKTFFYLAKQANVDIGVEKKNEAINVPIPEVKENVETIVEQTIEFKTNSLPSQVYENLPALLNDCCALFVDGIEKDIFFLSALTVASGCFPKIEGEYFNRFLSPHMFLFITGPSASGKSTMIWARYLANAIHEDKVNQSNVQYSAYLVALEVYENLPKNQKLTSGKPEEPPRYVFFIPANCSSSALTQLLYENNFRGIIFETEADTLTNTAKQDWGDSSDIFRKAFHHENTSMARRQNKELIEIKEPHLAMCLSGTPKQVHNLMPDVENGLFSRFMYYAFQDNREFLNPFISYQPLNYESFFTQKGYEIFHFYEKLQKLSENIRFELTVKQAVKFTCFFQKLLSKNKLLLCRDLDASTKRLGIITFRLAMTLSALRLMEIPIGTVLPSTLICTDVDFDNALLIASTLEAHAVAVYQTMPKVKMKGIRLSLYEKLPLIFERKEYIEVAKQLGISVRSADRWIALMVPDLLSHEYNSYRKILNT